MSGLGKYSDRYNLWSETENKWGGDLLKQGGQSRLLRGMIFKMKLKELARCAESEARRELGSKGSLEYGTFSHLDWKRLKSLTNPKFWRCREERESSHPV